MATEGEETKSGDVSISESGNRRTSRLDTLIRESRRSISGTSYVPVSHEYLEQDGIPEEREEIQASLRRRMSVFEQQDTNRLVEVRLKDFSYHVPIRMMAPNVKTVMNQSVCYAIYEFFNRLSLYCKRGRHAAREGQGMRSSMWLPRTASDIVNPFASKPILNEINLILKPGTTYLVLGPPGSGKTSLLKAIAGRLPNHVLKKKNADPPKDSAYQTGRVEYNGVATVDEPDMIVPNICSFVGQLDDHAPYLTVKETFEFAFQCRTGGELEHIGIHESQIESSQRQNFTENLTIDGMDLTQCADTFVGDSNVRGISGGQRRRVTVGEMMQGANPVACADEFSTGLDAAVTYDIAFSIVRFAKAAKTTRIVSLLQPGPETFSLFDEVIVLSDGHVIYAGPIEDVVDYFARLGYIQPDRMDVADFLQSIPTPDGALLFDSSRSPSDEHYTSQEFADAFKQSEQYQQIIRDLGVPGRLTWTSKNINGTSDDEEQTGDEGSPAVPDDYMKPWQNSFCRSTKLNFWRNFTLWKRDKGFIIGKMFENIGMAVATGGILFGQAQIPDLPANATLEQVSAAYDRLQAGVYGALFMTCFHILLGTMTSTPDEIDSRSIHYKQYDARFYQVYTFVIGRFLSSIPQRSIEIVSFGIPLYFLVGFDLSAASFFMYLCLLICYTIGLKMFFGIFAQILPKKANVQGVGTFVVLLATLFGGFIVYPNAIPGYYQWIYWMNPMAWTLQGLVSIEFTSGKYDEQPLNGDGLLATRGFQLGREWIGYSFAFMIPFTFAFSVILGIVLKYVRIEPEQSQIQKMKSTAIGKIEEKTNDEDFNIPFTPVDLTFEKLVYEVKASTGNDTLKLLNEVSGAFVSGRMCALMGSSGAGKTTLMDVIAMRKTSGTITGTIQLNGFDQEKTSFLRCSGYVEQFDVQQAELTVRETVTFCARLRLDASDPEIGNDAGKLHYVDHVLETMELCDIENLQVGSYEEGGLTFEQRKRLAIACELAGSPSVIFLDEPTSGLDSRGALVVIRAMRRIADSGRTVCATIHQPSAAVFEMFDDLLLLKRGGNVVFFGDLGEGSSKLVEYFESRGAPSIERGENPAAWMLRCMSSEGTEDQVDWAEVYKVSDQYAALCEKIETVKESADESMKITFKKDFPTTKAEREKLMNRRIITVYKRSPAYNLTRLMIAIFYAFLIGSVFIRTRKGTSSVWNEVEVDGVISTMFLSLIIMGVTSISMAVPVMKKIRDVFYKHRASGMLTHNSISSSLLVGETVYLCLIAALFGVFYYLTVGLFGGIGKFGIFWSFTILNLANYTYFGQAFICLVKDVPTAGALVGALIGYNVFFSGLIVKPQYFSGPFQLGLWTAPGRFAFEGITMSQFSDVNVPVIAEPYSPYFFYLGCDNATAVSGQDCDGTMDDFVQFYFGGKFSVNNFWLDIGVLLGYLVLARFLTWFSLKKFNYVNT